MKDKWTFFVYKTSTVNMLFDEGPGSSFMLVAQMGLRLYQEVLLKNT